MHKTSSRGLFSAVAIAAVTTIATSSAMAATLPGTTLTPSVWFDASQIQGATDGAKIMTWNDASGNGRDATARAAAPTYRTNVVGGKPTLRFNDGVANESMVFNGALANSAGAELDLFVVSGSTSPVISGRAGTISTRGSTAGGFFFGYASTTVGTYFHPGHSHAGNPSLGVGGGGQHQINIRANPNPAEDPLNFNVMTLDRIGLTEEYASFSDGGVAGSEVTWSGFTPSAAAVPVTYVGTNGPDGFFRGDIAEIIAFEGGLTRDQRREVIGYLGQKYDITAAAALVPEPATLGVVGFAMAGLLVRRRAR